MSDQPTTNNQQSTSAKTTADKSTIFSDWLKRLKDEGKTDEEIGQLLAGVAKLSALDVYAALMTSLTEEDMKEVEAIGDDEQAKQKMEELFKLRSGMTVDEMIQKAQEGFARGYIATGQQDNRLQG